MPDMIRSRKLAYPLPKRRLSGIALCLLASHGLTACNRIGPDFEPPTTRVASAWLDGNEKQARPAAYRSWWKAFRDPLLDRLIDRAFQQNLDLQRAGVNLLEARAQLGIAKGLLFPQTTQFGMNGGYERLSGESPYYQGFNDYEFPYFQTGFDTAWELDIWGRLRRGVEASGAQLTSRTLDYDDLLVTLTAEVASAYTQIRTFQQRLALAQSNADLQERSYKIAESQYRNGLSTELDMQQASALKQQTLAEIANLESGLRQSKNGLCLLLGMQPSHLTQELGTGTEIPRAASRIQEGIPADMVRRRPDVRAAQFRAAEQSARIGIAQSELLPRLTLVGTVSYATGSFDVIDAMNSLTPSGLAGKFGPTITWPIFQFGRLKNNVRAQDARFQALLIDYQNTVLKALREVEDALIAFRKAEQRVTSLEEGVTASRRAATLALKQYQNGLEDYTRVLNSELLLVQQQDKLTLSRGEVTRYLIAAYKALGGGWEIREGKPLLPNTLMDTMKNRTDWGGLLDEPAASYFNRQDKPADSGETDYFEEAL